MYPSKSRPEMDDKLQKVGNEQSYLRIDKRCSRKRFRQKEALRIVLGVSSHDYIPVSFLVMRPFRITFQSRDALHVSGGLSPRPEI